MNLSAAYLAIVAFSTFPRLVRGSDWMRVSLLDDILRDADEEHQQPSFPTISFLDPFYESSSLSSMIRRQQQMKEEFETAFFGRGGPPTLRLMSPATTSTSTSIFNPPELQLQPQPAVSSSSIQVTNDPNQFKVTISQLPSGLSPEDLKVDFDEGTRQLTISGQYEFTNEETSYRSVSKFSRSFSLDPFVEVDQLQANVDVETNVLTVTAPKNHDKMEHSLRSIPVVMNQEQEQPQMVVLEIKSSSEEKEEESTEIPPPEASSNKSNEEEEEEQQPDEEGEGEPSYNDSFDPFHIKERVQKTLSFRQQTHNENEANSSNLLDDTTSGFKTSELRRRRRN